MENLDRAALILDAMELVEQAMALVDQAVAGTSIQGNYEAYGKYGFSQLLGNGNRYDSGLPDLINGLTQDDSEDES